MSCKRNSKRTRGCGYLSGKIFQVNISQAAIIETKMEKCQDTDSLEKECGACIPGYLKTENKNKKTV